MVLLELGGAFTAALAIAGGQIVDGLGGSSGPLGVRAAGALDGELAYLLGPALRKSTLFTGGALDPRAAGGDVAALWASPAHAEGWTALLEAAAKAVRGLLVSVPAPLEIVVSGRLARVPELVGVAGRVAARRRARDRARPGASERSRSRGRAAGRRAGGRVAMRRSRRSCGCASPAAPHSPTCASPGLMRSSWADKTTRGGARTASMPTAPAGGEDAHGAPGQTGCQFNDQASN